MVSNDKPFPSNQEENKLLKKGGPKGRLTTVNTLSSFSSFTFYQLFPNPLQGRIQNKGVEKKKKTPV